MILILLLIKFPIAQIESIIVINKNVDRKPIPLRDDVGKSELTDIIQRFIICDIWRKRHPNDKRFTFSWGP